MDYDFSKWMHDYQVISSVGENKEGGIDRLALTQQDFTARTELLNRAYGLHLKCLLDGANNLWLRKEGTDPSLPPLLIGSHLDTVPNGGRYDGVLGVMAGFQVLRYLSENHVEHRRTVELVAFCCEESSRFNLSTVGSKLVTERIDVSKLKDYQDSNGQNAADCLYRLCLAPDCIQERIEHLKNIYGFLELHIEQGPVLEAGGIDIGIVESIAAPIRLKLNFVGHSDHSGACPMNLRHDALVAAAAVITEVERLGKEESLYKSVATVGKCNVPHQALNVVPGAAELFVDIRGILRESVERIYSGLLKCCDQLEKERGIKIEHTLLADEYPVDMNRELGKVIQRNCEMLGLSYLWMPSGAGHDAMNVAKVAPAAMIFIPCVGGISHNPNEMVLERDMKNSIKILYEVVMDICQTCVACPEPQMV